MKCAARFAVFAFTLAVTLPAAALAQVYQGTDFVYETYREIRTNGNDSTYSQGLTHRYVNGELRFLTLTLKRTLQEYRLPSAGQVQTSVTNQWDLSGVSGAFLHGFHGIWFEQAKNRLWITTAEDYTATNHPARVTLIELGASGSFRVLKQFFLDKPAKRVYGGCNAVPAALVASIGGPYVCGWGGYTSLVMQGGNASIGPTMYAIPDPDTIANGSTVRARTVLDAADAQTNRGVRVTIPKNYFDGGDPRQNPSTRPTGDPVSSGRWLSPNGQGLGWMVWGDSYYNTGFWIGTTYGAIASLCKGACWYESSTLAFDGRQFELHLWDGSKLGSNRLERPTSMIEMRPPIDPSRTPAGGRQGNVPVNNLAGATYDPVSGRLYVIGFAMGDAYTARLYSYRVGTATGQIPSGSGGTTSPPPRSAPSAPSTPSTPPPSTGSSTSSCSTIRPGADWNCYNGNWLPPGMPVPGQSSQPPKQPLLPSAPNIVGSLLKCLSIKPGEGWNCYNGNWLPPGMPLPKGATRSSQGSQTPSKPSAPSSSSGCTSVRPGLLWVCRGGNWLPPGHPDA
jgi:hypothetical protein